MSDLGNFYRHNLSFVIGPVITATLIRLVLGNQRVAAVLSQRGAAPYGLRAAGTYAVAAIMLAYAVHGWFTVHLSQRRQLQSFDGKRKGEAKPTAYAQREPPAREAVRTVATLLTSLVYSLVPFSPPTTTWTAFIAWTFALAVYWDLHFFLVHKAAHESRWLYIHVHKLHHMQRQPSCFSAYYVTYPSHVLTEQAVVLLAAACGLPVDVFTWTLWWGTLQTLLDHGGHDVGSIRLSPLPITLEQLSLALSPWGLVLGGAGATEHDWHHENFNKNYSLSFTYLDRVFGSYHPGRVAGEAIGIAHTTERGASAHDGLGKIPHTASADSIMEHDIGYTSDQ